MTSPSRPLLAAGALLAALGAVPPAAPAQDAPPGVGSYAPAFELPDCTGELRRLAWTDGGPGATIVFFFDPQSRDSLHEMSFLDALYARAKDFGLAVWAVEGGGRQPAEVNRALERYCAVYRTPAFAILPDPSRRTGRTYGVRQVPTTFLAEQHGIILRRFEGFGPAQAVDLTRRVESLLRRPRRYFSDALRSADVSPGEEERIEEQLAAAVAAEAGRAAPRTLVGGDRAPRLEFVDLGGREGRWTWGEGAPPARVVYFWGEGSLPSVEGMIWLDGLDRRGREAGMETVAIEATGLDAAAVAEAMERYRRLNPAPAFPVVADPGQRIVRAFGALDRLPQTYLVAADGAILHRVEGFDAAEAALLAGKAERAFLLAGRPFPESAPAGASGAPATADAGEAPSIREGREREARFRSAIVQGDAYFVAWEFERALPYYLQALEIQPRDLHALVRAAQIADRLGGGTRARDLWERVIRLRPDHAEARERLNELRR